MTSVFTYAAVSHSSQTLHVWDLTLHAYSSEYHCFNLLWLVLAKWDKRHWSRWVGCLQITLSSV